MSDEPTSCGRLTITYRASSLDEISELHTELEGMCEVDADDGRNLDGYDEAIALIQQPDTDYVLEGAIARRVMAAIENWEDSNVPTVTARPWG